MAKHPESLFRRGMILEGEGEHRTANAAAKTFPGMAHFGGTGPPSKTCRECKYFEIPGDGTDAYYVSTNTLKGQTCAKCRDLMNNPARLPPVPPIARACKYFDLHEAPLPLYKK